MPVCDVTSRRRIVDCARQGGALAASNNARITPRRTIFGGPMEHSQLCTGLVAAVGELVEEFFGIKVFRIQLHGPFQVCDGLRCFVVGLQLRSEAAKQ